MLAAFLLMCAAAWAGTPVKLPAGESTLAWEEALRIAGLTASEVVGRPGVELWKNGGRWEIRAWDSTGVLRTASVPAPISDQDREDVAILAASLARATRTGGLPKPPAPVVVPPPAPPVAVAPTPPVAPAPKPPKPVAEVKPPVVKATPPPALPEPPPVAPTPPAVEAPVVAELAPVDPPAAPPVAPPASEVPPATPVVADAPPAAVPVVDGPWGPTPAPAEPVVPVASAEVTPSALEAIGVFVSAAVASDFRGGMQPAIAPAARISAGLSATFGYVEGSWAAPAAAEGVLGRPTLDEGRVVGGAGWQPVEAVPVRALMAAGLSAMAVRDAEGTPLHAIILAPLLAVRLEAPIPAGRLALVPGAELSWRFRELSLMADDASGLAVPEAAWRVSLAAELKVW